MTTSNSERVKKSLQKFSRPTITIDRNKNPIYKEFVKEKGYQSLNDYFNTVIEYDMKNNIIPNKNNIKNK